LDGNKILMILTENVSGAWVAQWPLNA